MKKYYYLRNAQNDVIAIADSTGTVVVRYYYDAWGKLLRVTDGAGNAVTDESHVGVVNPIRYRGYYYDSETGYYLTGTRYYDPVVGRFISSDVEEAISQEHENFAQYNLYAYCFNNPVNMSDENGTWPKWLNWKNVAKVAVGVAAVAVGVAATVATGGAAATALLGAVKAVAISTAIGAGVGAGTSAVSHRVSTGSWQGAGKAALNGGINGAIDGFMSGGIMAGGSQVISAGFKAAANSGVKTGIKGGVQLTKNVKVLSPNHKDFYDAGGTLLKIGTKASNIRFDVGVKSLFHMNVQFGKNIHVPIGMLGSGLYGGLKQWK